MKVMISLPMNGRKNEEIKERMKELKEKFAKLHIDVIDSFLTDEIENSYHPGVYYLGRTLTQFMHNVDAVYFDGGWEKARGCRIERNICNEYDIKILDESFFMQPSITTVIQPSITTVGLPKDPYGIQLCKSSTDITRIIS